VNFDRIISTVATSVAPTVQLGTAVEGGLLVTVQELEKAWESVLQKFGCENGAWTKVGPYLQAYNRDAAKLEGLEKWLADTVMNLAQEANAGGYQEISGLGMNFVSSKSACRACPDEQRLTELSVTARISNPLRSRRVAVRESKGTVEIFFNTFRFRSSKYADQELDEKIKELNSDILKAWKKSGSEDKLTLSQPAIRKVQAYGGPIAEVDIRLDLASGNRFQPYHGDPDDVWKPYLDFVESLEKQGYRIK
jgi:hypothetical protein